MAAEKDKKDENEAEEQVPEKKKGSVLKWIIIGIVTVVVLGGGASAAFLLLKSGAPADGKKPAELNKPVVAVFYPLDPYIVNLIDNEGERYLKVVMQLELSDPSVVEELNLVKPRLRDAILDLLSAKTYKEMMDPLGKQRLRDEIMMRGNMFTTKGKVTKVYFTEFVIQ
jgi:flagellar FliL protein